MNRTGVVSYPAAGGLRGGLSSAGLHILAMALMLCDHVWAMLLPQQEWLTNAGRLAFPIFAFLCAEGFARSHDRRAYLRRLVVLALLSEVPFDLMYADTAFYPMHQNVIWTFVLAVGLMALCERARATGKRWAFVLTAVGCTAAGLALGTLTMVDYYGAGVVTVLVFYFFRQRKGWCFLAQLACLYWIHVKLLGGYYFTVPLFGREVEIVQQGLALAALVPIWLYRGRQGYHARWWRVFCYGFYPGHMLLLYFIWLIRAG